MNNKTTLTTAVAAFIVLAVLTTIPAASAGNALGYTCDLQSDGRYKCQGYGIQNSNEYCSVRWTDTDTDDDWEDSGAIVTHISCNGEVANDPVPWLPSSDA